MNGNVDRSALLYCIHVYLIKEADKEGIIERRKLPAVLGRGFHIPKQYHRRVVTELQGHGIIIDSQKNFVKVKIIDLPF